jgi:hypothetical protein
VVSPALRAGLGPAGLDRFTPCPVTSVVTAAWMMGDASLVVGGRAALGAPGPHWAVGEGPGNVQLGPEP